MVVIDGKKYYSTRDIARKTGYSVITSAKYLEELPDTMKLDTSHSRLHLYEIPDFDGLKKRFDERNELNSRKRGKKKYSQEYRDKAELRKNIKNIDISTEKAKQKIIRNNERKGQLQARLDELEGKAN
jgi:hypothetical protein